MSTRITRRWASLTKCESLSAAVWAACLLKMAEVCDQSVSLEVGICGVLLHPWGPPCLLWGLRCHSDGQVGHGFEGRGRGRKTEALWTLSPLWAALPQQVSQPKTHDLLRASSSLCRARQLCLHMPCSSTDPLRRKTLPVWGVQSSVPHPLLPAASPAHPQQWVLTPCVEVGENSPPFYVNITSSNLHTKEEI